MKTPYSLRSRLLASTALILILFMVLTGFALDRALSTYTRHAEHDRLQGLIYSLLGAADINPTGQLGISLDRVPAPRLQQPGSGLIAAVYDSSGRLLWHSPSLLGAPPRVEFPGRDQWRFETNGDTFTLRYGLEWLLDGPAEEVVKLTVLVSDTASPLLHESRQLSHRLWFWLLLISALLLAAMATLMYWGLRPLQAIRSNLDAIRNGQASRLDITVPAEIRPLTQSLNELIEHQDRQQQRFRDALADLAHSLKTPLAVISNSKAASEDPQLSQQLQRMNEIIGYQLKRAATGNVPAITTPPIEVQPVITRVTNALGKVYADKGVTFDVAISKTFSLQISTNDLMELCGNLLDNAAKYSRMKVRIGVENGMIVIEDDGPGFPPNAQALLQRGQRADSRVSGQGIGLAVAADIAHAHGWKLVLGRSARFGGARVAVGPGK